MKKGFFILVIILVIAPSVIVWWEKHWPNDLPVPSPTISDSPSFLKVPEGFKISVAAKNLDNPRVIIFDQKGRMLISETKAGRVSVLEDQDKNGEFETKHVLIENLKSPHGLDFYEDGHNIYLYIAETHQVVRYIYDLGKGEITNRNAGENIASLPSGGDHFTRTIAFGPNYRKTPLLTGNQATLNPNKLYISVGSSCDVCVESNWKNAAILETDPEGSFTAEFAGGLRNSIFFTFHPETHEIWATETGRNNLGDNFPPDEINIVKVAGLEDKFGARRYGWPFCYGRQVKDKTFSTVKIARVDLSADCSQTEPATIELPANSAPLGLIFIAGSRWPKEWQNDLLVAYHGSWNRNEKTGYKIGRFKVDKNGHVFKTEDFITGWLDNGKVSGRPVDLKFGQDGALYISDDLAGIIYRVSPSK